MKTLVLFFTSLLITSMFIGCGDSSSGDSGGSGTVNIPGGGSVSTETKSNSGKTITTGLTSSTGCKDTDGTLPGCAK